MKDNSNYGERTGMTSEHKCPTCGQAMVHNIHRTYVYCVTHPGVIKYDDEAWATWIIEQNKSEWESLRRLESGD